MELITLYAYRIKTVGKLFKTVLRTGGGKIKAIFPDNQTQPHKNKKTIIINCTVFKLVFD